MCVCVCIIGRNRETLRRAQRIIWMFILKREMEGMWRMCRRGHCQRRGDRKAQVTKVTTGTLGRHCRLRSSRRSRSSNSHLAVVQRLKTCSVMKRCAPCSIAPCFLSHSSFFPFHSSSSQQNPLGSCTVGGKCFPPGLVGPTRLG